jgi:hypothetical protein
MEARHAELRKHTSGINAVLKEACEAPNAGPLVWEKDLVIRTLDAAPLSRRVTTDLGSSDFALRLPIPDTNQPRFWISLHESWEWKNRRTVRFRECGLGLYIGNEDEEAIQILRLEWVAPTFDLSRGDQEPVYAGKHAGHPHWHIDKSALGGPDKQAGQITRFRIL